MKYVTNVPRALHFDIGTQYGISIRDFPTARREAHSAPGRAVRDVHRGSSFALVGRPYGGEA